MREFIDGFEKLKLKWEIYQFSPEGKGIDSIHDFECGSDCFSRVKKLVKDVVGEENFSSREDRDSAYFLIRPDGTVVVPKDNGDCISEYLIGDLKTDDIRDVLSKWWDIASISLAMTGSRKRSTRPSSPLAGMEERDLLQKIQELGLFDKEDISDNKRDNIRLIESLMDKGAIKYMMPMINVGTLGLKMYVANLFFDRTVDKSQIIWILENHPKVSWVVECENKSERERDISEYVILIHAMKFTSYMR